MSSVQAKSLRKPLDSSKKDGISIEIHDLNEKGPLPSHRGDLVGTQLGFDFERWIRFMAWGMSYLLQLELDRISGVTK